MFKNKVFRNASWIIGCRIVQSLFALIIGMLTARYLGPSNFGVINYAASVVAFVVPIMYIGMNNILVNELVAFPDNEGNILGTALVMSFLSSLLCIAGVITFVSIANAGEMETLVVCALYSVLLIFQGLELIQYWFQAKLLSKYTSIVMLCAYVLVSLYKIVLLITGKSIYWFAVSYAFDYALISISLIIIYRKLGGQHFSVSFSTAKILFSKGKYYIVSSMMVTIFAQTDKIMLKLMVNDAAVGYYSAAVTIAGMTGFVFGAIMDSLRPVIFQNKKESQAKYQENISRLYCIIIYFALLQSVFISLLSNYIVLLLYGSQYIPSISALRIIVWYTTFSYLGAVRNIWILAEEKHKFLWIINLSGAVTNIILNLALIPYFGINGAAIASLITQIFTNIIMGYIMKPIRPNNRLMVRGLNPMLILKIFKHKNRR